MVLPNQLTVLRIILTPIFLVLFLSGEPTLIQISVVVYLIAAITDWYDGWLARKFNYITEWGKFMDPLADKILTSAAFLGFVFIGVLPLWMVLIVIARDMLITLLRAYADFRKVAFSTSHLAQWKTFFQMIFLYYLLFIHTLSTFKEFYSTKKNLFDLLLNPSLVYYTMLFITLLTVITGIAYLYNDRFLFRKLFKNEN